MCGAAAESILLAVACTIKPEEEVLKTYGSAMGRSRVENMIIGQARERLRPRVPRLSYPSQVLA